MTKFEFFRWLVKRRIKKLGQDDIYIGTRQTMGDVKLTLHQADDQGREAGSRLAFTREIS
jgi:hypothetical protein